MKVILRYFGTFAVALVVGIGCSCIDARANPVLWYMMWALFLVLAAVNVWLEWGIWPRWVCVASLLLFYVPAWVALWLSAWGYISGEAAFWIIFAGVMVECALQAIVGPTQEGRTRTLAGSAHSPSS